MTGSADWEGVADAVLSATGLDAPIDAFEVAVARGFSLRTWGGTSAMRIGDRIYYPRKARITRQHRLILHEVAHVELVRHGEEDSESGAHHVARALLLPRQRMLADLAKDWDLSRLMELHPNASGELIAKRIASLTSAVVTILDQGRVRERLSRAGTHAHAMSDEEAEIADEALSSQHKVSLGPCRWAVPLIDPPHHRVILVVDEACAFGTSALYRSGGDLC